MRSFIIAIDGYASCGKSTLAKQIATQLGFTYIDSGAMYRAVTLYLIRNRMVIDGKFDIGNVVNSLNDIHILFRYNAKSGCAETFLNNENVEEEIRKAPVSDNVSPVSTIAEVRARMVELQRQMSKSVSVVMDGRDIGTVVFPNADVKLFMTANPDVRAQRRFSELERKGEIIDLTTVKAGLLERDRIDENRKIAPLKKADDALVLDNSYLSEQEQLAKALEIISRKTGLNTTLQAH